MDTINQPAKRDLVACGRGFITVIADTRDAVAPDCEKVVVPDEPICGSDPELKNSEFFERFFYGLAPFPEQ